MDILHSLTHPQSSLLRSTVDILWVVNITEKKQQVLTLTTKELNIEFSCWSCFYAYL